MDIEVRRAISDEASRIEEDSAFSSKGHYNSEAYWQTSHYVVGSIAVLSGVISSISAHSGNAWIAVVASTTASLAATAITFFNPSQRAQEHKAAGDCFGALRNDARIFRTIELPQLSTEIAASDKLQEYNRRRAELNTSSPGIPAFAYEKARRHIDEEGRATHRVDKEG